MKRGLAILGSYEFVVAQRVLLSQCRSLRMVGWAGSDSAAQGRHEPGRWFASAEELLASGEVHAVSVGGDIAQRAHWCLDALARGYTVFCAHPLSDRLADVREVIAAASNHGGRLQVVDRSAHGEIARGLADPRWSSEPPLFLNLEVHMPRQALESQHQGVLLCAAAGYLGRVRLALGQVDSVWAETRSLARWGPCEDVATAYVRLMDGCEGAVHICGLGHSWEARLVLHGPHWSESWTDGAETEVSGAWRRAYAEFEDGCLGLGTRAGFQRVLEGHRMIEWIQRAARLRREVTHGEGRRRCV